MSHPIRRVRNWSAVGAALAAAAALIVVDAPPLVAAPVVVTHTNADFDGNGITDWSTVRDVGGSFVWYIENTSGFSATTFGTAATDLMVPADYDGDGKSDIAVWRPGSPGTFWVLNSSTGLTSVIPWGATNDDPTVTADFDGDGKADPAVYRCPPIGSPGQCFYWVLKSTGGVMVVPWGFGQQFDYFAAPGDYDGDGKADFAVQSTAPSGAPAGIFQLLRSSDFGYEALNWGLNTDIIVPGDYDGDTKSDWPVSRTTPSGRVYYILDRTGGVTYDVWGVAGDVRAPGDYDGDGKTDLAIWRSSPTPGASGFWVKRSSDGGVVFKPFGAQGDDIPAAWTVH